LEEGKQGSGEFEYTITTVDGNRFVFDVRTGEITSASRVERESRWGWWLALGVVAVAGTILLVRRQSRGRRAEAERGATPDPAAGFDSGIS
jgi:hypothetical protein